VLHSEGDMWLSRGNPGSLKHNLIPLTHKIMNAFMQPVKSYWNSLWHTPMESWLIDL